MLCGSGEHEPNAETATQLAQEIYSAMLMQLLIEHMTIIDFEVTSKLFISFLWSYTCIDMYCMVIYMSLKYGLG